MGTVASITFDSISGDSIDLRSVHGAFDHFDATYSLYRPDSELSLIASHALELGDATAEVRDTYAKALEWRAVTQGEFSPHRPDGAIDLSGIVKALAMNTAGAELTKAGTTNWCLNVGGDILVSGLDNKAEPWAVGIADPFDRGELLTSATLRGSRRACATSGSAERGDHIWTIGGAPTQFVQASVIADDIVTADVLATAIIAGGSTALDHSCANWSIDVLTIDKEGEIRMTPGFAMHVPSEQ
jgi:thiamine biosynthesis lipoprotein